MRRRPPVCEDSRCSNPAELELVLTARGEPRPLRQVVCVDCAARFYLPMIARTARAAGPYMLEVEYVRAGDWL